MALGLIATGTAVAAEKTYTVTVDAGKSDRSGSVVEFDLPKDAAAGPWYLARAGGPTVAVQVRAGGHAAFVLPEPLAAGASQSFKLESGAADAQPAVAAARKG